MSGTRKCLPVHHYKGIPKRRMKETLFTRHRNTVEPMRLADNRKATLQAIHTEAVNKAVNDQKKNIVFDDLPHPINDSEKDLTGKERVTLAQVRSGYCKLLGFYESRIKKGASLNVCVDCGQTPHDVKHLFACPAHPTTLIPSDLWNKPMDSIREFRYLDAENKRRWEEIITSTDLMVTAGKCGR